MSGIVGQDKMTPEQALAHFGVKGMKWGVRKDRPRGKVRRGLTKAGAALDAGGKVIDEGEKRLIFLPQKHRESAASNTQIRVLGEARAINQSPQFKGKDLKGNTRLRNAYMKKVEEAAKTVYAEELNISRTEAWGEFLGVETNATTNYMRISAAKDRVRHADDDDRETLLEMNFEVDALGHIVKVNVPDKYLKHAGPDAEDDVIVHYGVKGMKWGVRKDVTKADISDARLRVAGRNVKYFQERAKIKRSDSSRGEKKAALSELKIKTLNDPDRLTALRMTNGEKAAVAVLTFAAPPVAVSLVAQQALAARQINKAHAKVEARKR